MVYYQLSLDKKISKMWKKDKYCKRLKEKRSLSKSVETILMRILERSRRIKTLENVYAKVKLLNILDEVIGSDYFGNSQNRKRFYYLVNKITTQSRFECVYLSILSKGYNIKAIPWLQQEKLDEVESRKLLQRTNLYLLTYVVKPLIKHFYHALKSFRGYEIKFIERKKWHSFQHKILSELLKQKYITPVNKAVCKSCAVLRLFPKMNNCGSLEYRPLISPIRYTFEAKAKFKRISKQIDNLARQTSIIGGMSIFLAWKRFTRETKDQQIYGIKLDIKDAFGNINVPKLCDIIRESKFSSTDKQFIINHIRNQYVFFHKKIYHWNHGLLQGDRLSSSLCNLFISDFEKDNLMAFCKPGRFLHRMVDDYFFCSIDKEDIDQFELKVKSMFSLNEAKTQMVDGSGNCEISYYGQVFNIKTREVGKLYSFKKDCSVRHKFKFWNVKKPVPEKNKQNIVYKTLDFPYNNHCFKKIELNTKFNTEEKVLMNYFEGMIFIGFKFEAAVMAIKEYKQQVDDIPSLIPILEKVIYNYSNIVYFKIQRCKGSYYTGSVSFRLLKNVAYRAFILVLKKSYEFYKPVINYIKKKNNLYLQLEKLELSAYNFFKLPKEFEDIRLGRRSSI